MRTLRSRAAAVAVVMSVAAWPATAAAQRAAPSPGRDAAAFAEAVRAAVVLESRDAAAQDDAAAAERRWRRKRHLPALGAAIGAGIGALLTLSVAERYGNNEGGGTCGSCFLRWGLIAIPVGAGAGAAIGLAARGKRPESAAPASTPPEGASASLGWRQELGVTVRF